jgi:hypothetical protein
VWNLCASRQLPQLAGLFPIGFAVDWRRPPPIHRRGDDTRQQHQHCFRSYKRLYQRQWQFVHCIRLMTLVSWTHDGVACHAREYLSIFGSVSRARASL